VRKPRRLPAEVLAPYQWEPPGGFRFRWGTGLPSHPKGEGDTISWPSLFHNHNPVEIEVGFGKGMYLLAAAVAHPDRNFFGIEIVRKYQLYATTRIAGRALANVKTCCGDAKAVFRDHVVPGSVAAVHVYFPDPWWKTRHRKRLLFTPEFADLVAKVLRPGGTLQFATDVEDYFGMVTGMLTGKPLFVPLPPPAERPPEHDLDYLTNFERKFRKQGKPIWRATYEKGRSLGTNT
jgi:tRNA (guanine-N7-)-methyltransferase